MADAKVASNAAPAEAQKETPKATKINRKAIMASRMAAVQQAGNMTPQMQRGFDRFAANIQKREG